MATTGKHEFGWKVATDDSGAHVEKMLTCLECHDPLCEAATRGSVLQGDPGRNRDVTIMPFREPTGTILGVRLRFIRVGPKVMDRYRQVNILCSPDTGITLSEPSRKTGISTLEYEMGVVDLKDVCMASIDGKILDWASAAMMSLIGKNHYSPALKELCPSPIHKVDPFNTPSPATLKRTLAMDALALLYGGMCWSVCHSKGNSKSMSYESLLPSFN